MYISPRLRVFLLRVSHPFPFPVDRRHLRCRWGKPLYSSSVVGKRLRPAVELSFIIIYNPLLIIRRWCFSSPSLSSFRPTHSSHVRKTALLMLIYPCRASRTGSLLHNGISPKCRCPPNNNCSFRSSSLPLFLTDFVFPTRVLISFMF